MDLIGNKKAASNYLDMIWCGGSLKIDDGSSLVVIVRSGKIEGKMTIKAEAAGLKGAVLNIRTR